VSESHETSNPTGSRQDPYHLDVGDVEVTHYGGKSINRLTSQSWVLVGMLALLAFGLIGIGGVFLKESSDFHTAIDKVQTQGAQQLDDLRCIAEWATAQTAASQRRLDATNQRTTALDDLVRTVADPRRTPAEFTKALQAYITASDEYNAEVKKSPIPTSPQFTCFTNRGADGQPAPSPTRS
jgi:hypothetical protein